MYSLVVEHMSVGKAMVMILSTTKLGIIIIKILFSAVYTGHIENSREVHNLCSFLNIESCGKDQIYIWEMENSINGKL